MLTFVPFHVLHPVRVVRLRWLTMSLIGIWAVLSLYTLDMDFRVGPGRDARAVRHRALDQLQRRIDPLRKILRMMHLLASPEAWAALLTLTSLEIVLGIDNVIFLSVIVSRIPEKQAQRARQIGLALALVFRIILLSVLVWLIGLTAPGVLVCGLRFLLARPHPDRRRPVPDREGDARDSRRGRSR
ncbi:hypothetical protein BRDID11002_43650 [Bradyrhizobium diazoefficiens]